LLIPESSTIVQDIQSISIAKKGLIGLAYFYCDASDYKNRSVTDILSSLIIQLLAWQPSNHSPLDEAYGYCVKVVFPKGPLVTELSKPSVKRLYEVLRQLLSGFEMAYVLIDAVDESLHMGEILKFIKTLHGWNKRECHLLVTSRKEQQIVESMVSAKPIEIDMSQMPVDVDIEKYIEFVLHSSPELERWGPDEKDLIRKVLLQNANGM
jgi:hypothetical protein